LRLPTLILGAVLTVYASAGLLFETFYADSAEAERVLCRFLLCHNARLVWSAREQLTGPKDADLAGAIGAFRTVLQRDPHDPNRWSDLGEAFLEAGRKQDARYCYQRVEALAPRVPPLLLRVASFHFLSGEPRRALPVTARILGMTPAYDAVIFSQYTRLADNADVLRFGLPQDSRAARSWLRFLMEAGRLEEAQRSWDWVAGHGLADDAVAGEYAWFLVRRGRPEAAWSAWKRPTGPFHWSLARSAGVEIARDGDSLRIRFAGTENLEITAASKHVFVRPGTVRFRARIRTDGVTTDQGIRFRIFDAEAPARLNLTFGQFTGTNPWSDVQQDLVVPPQTRLLQIQVIREPSLRFDNRVGGSAWINAIELAPASR
jgi:hypothetical protein